MRCQFRIKVPVHVPNMQARFNEDLDKAVSAKYGCASYEIISVDQDHYDVNGPGNTLEVRCEVEILGDVGM